MEPSARNPWQPTANATAANMAQIGEKRCGGLPPVAAEAHGKEGVDGSSPSVGFAKPLRSRAVFHVIVANFGDCGSHRGRTRSHAVDSPL
jgi:hypothetical protein